MSTSDERGRHDPLHPERIARDAAELDIDPNLLADARRASADVAEGPTDPGHYMTDAEWRVVQDRAELHRHGDASGPRDVMRGARALAAGVTVLNWQAKFFGGAQTPTVQVVHDAETPLRDGYARSIGQFFVDGPRAGTSAHRMVDPHVIVKLLPLAVVGYHVGAVGNRGTVGYEQAGYARFTRAEWTTSDGLAQIDVLASVIADDAKTLGIADRRLTDAQLAAWAAGGRRLADGGRVTHFQVGRVLGGTTHTDPEPNYPHDLLDVRVSRYRSGAVEVPPARPEEQDMRIIAREQDFATVLLLGTGTRRPVTSNAVIAAYRHAGVPYAVLAPADFDAIVAATPPESQTAPASPVPPSGA